MPAMGLQTYIWNKKWTVWFFIVLYLFSIALFFSALSFLVSIVLPAQNTLDFAFDFICTLGLFFILVYAFLIAACFIWSDNLLAWLCRSKPLRRKDNEAFWNKVENLSIQTGHPMPRIYIMEDPGYNLFSYGLPGTDGSITVTRGFLENFKDDEQRAALAQEYVQLSSGRTASLSLFHVLSSFFLRVNDALFGLFIILTSMLKISGNFFFAFIKLLLLSCFLLGLIYIFSIPFSFFTEQATGIAPGGSAHSFWTSLLVFCCGFFILSYLGPLLLMEIFNKDLEFEADAKAVKLTGEPEAMIRALMKVNANSYVRLLPPDLYYLCFVNNRKSYGLTTHPDVKDRISRLSKLTNTPLSNIKDLTSPDPFEQWKKDPRWFGWPDQL